MESDFKVGDLVIVRYCRTKEFWPALISKCNWGNADYFGLFKKTDWSYRKSGRSNGKFSPRPKPVERYCFHVLNGNVQKWADADDIHAFTPALVCPLDPISPNFQCHQMAMKMALDLYHKENAANVAHNASGINSCLVASSAEPPQLLRQTETSETGKDTANNGEVERTSHPLSGINAGPDARMAEQAQEHLEAHEIEKGAVEASTVLRIAEPQKEHHEVPALHVSAVHKQALENTVNHVTGEHMGQASPISVPSQSQHQPADAETGKDIVDMGTSNSCLLKLPLLRSTANSSAISARAVSENDSQQQPGAAETDKPSALMVSDAANSTENGVVVSVSERHSPPGPTPDSGMLNGHDYVLQNANEEGLPSNTADPEVRPVPFQPPVRPTAPNIVPGTLTPEVQSIPLLLPLCPSATKPPSATDLKSAHDEEHRAEMTVPEIIPSAPYSQVQDGEGLDSGDGHALRATELSSFLGVSALPQPGDGTKALALPTNPSIGAEMASAIPTARKGKRNHRRRRGKLCKLAADERRNGGQTAPASGENVTVGSRGTRTVSGEVTVDAELTAAVKIEAEEVRIIVANTENAEENPTGPGADYECSQEAQHLSTSIGMDKSADCTENTEVQAVGHGALLTYSPSTALPIDQNAAKAGQNAIRIEAKEELEKGSSHAEEGGTEAPQDGHRRAESISENRDIKLGDLVFAKYYNNPYWPGVIVTSNWRKSFGKWNRKKPDQYFCFFLEAEDCAWVHAKDVQLYNPADMPLFQVHKKHKMYSGQEAAIRAATDEYFARKAKAEEVECTAPETAASEGSTVADTDTPNVSAVELGDMVMAKVRGYPYWPGRIEMCPWKEQMFHEKWKMNDPVRFWCSFFDNTGNWVDGECVKPFTPESADGYLSNSNPDPEQKAAIEAATKLYRKNPNTGLGEKDAETSRRSWRNRKRSKSSERGIRRSKRRRTAPSLLSL